MQPLRIPPGWTFMFNKLTDIEPETLNKQDKIWLFAFTQDIMYMYAVMKRKQNHQMEEQKLSIDLGWYPDGDPDGHFRMVALINDCWEKPLLELISRSKREVVETLEQWLFQELMLHTGGWKSGGFSQEQNENNLTM